jgi:hypothetical protein
MSTKTREVIWGGRIMGANMRAEAHRKAAKEAAWRALAIEQDWEIVQNARVSAASESVG